MPWTKSPAELVQAFDAVVPPVAERRQMFGFPCAFVGGNLCFGLFQDRFMVRLDERGRNDALKVGAEKFEPMAGRPMREYVVLPPRIVSSPKQLEKWVARSVSYVGALPVKQPEPPAKKSANKPAKKATAKR